MGIVKTFFLAVVAKLAADEAKAWLSSASNAILLFAVKRLPEMQRERYREEWAADLDSYRGEFTKCCRAVGFVFACLRMSDFILEGLATLGQVVKQHQTLAWTLAFDVVAAAVEQLALPGHDSAVRSFLLLLPGSMTSYFAMYYLGRWRARRAQKSIGTSKTTT